MVDNGNDEYKEHFCDFNNGPKSWSCGSPYWTIKGLRQGNNLYTGRVPIFEFPAVPYNASHFHCKTTIENTDWGNIPKLNYGWLSGKQVDLNTENEYVQQRIADFLTRLISIGINGFSISNGKHISPENYGKIFGKLKENLGGSNFPNDLLIYLEMSISDQKYDFLCSDDENYPSFGKYFYKQLNNNGIYDSNDQRKIKLLLEYYPNINPYCDDNSNTKISLDRFVMSMESVNSIQFIDKNHIYIHQRNKN